jgi:hypothetical protein
MPKPPSRSSSGEIAQFLNTSRAITEVSRRQPRLLFGIDATASRQPTWDSACHLQHTMFQATRDIATLAIQLAYYRGLNEFHYTRWLTDTQALAQQMSAVSCLGGHTQIARLLRHALAQHRDQPVRALVFIGDALEESAATLRDLAGQCALRQLPVFVFQEGHDQHTEHTLRAIARISGGAWARFDHRSASTLAQLLGAVARYAAGGRAALADDRSRGGKLLLDQLPN